MMLLGLLAAQRVLAAVVNLLTNGAFAQGGSGWTPYSVSANTTSSSPSTANVAFDNGACQLLRVSSGFRSYTYGEVRRPLGGPATRVSAEYRVSFDYSAPAAPFSVNLNVGGFYGYTAQATSGRAVVPVVAQADDLPNFAIAAIAVSNGTAVTIDNVVVELVTPAPADFNYVAEGDFANGQGQWFGGYERDGSLYANNGNVTFNNGACQLRSFGADDYVDDAVIGRSLKGLPGAGGTYRVSFDQSFPNGAVSTNGRYEVVVGGKAQAYTPKQGRVTVDVVATTTNEAFRLFGSSYDGLPVTVDNIVINRI